MVLLFSQQLREIAFCFTHLRTCRREMQYAFRVAQSVCLSVCPSAIGRHSGRIMSLPSLILHENNDHTNFGLLIYFILFMDSNISALEAASVDTALSINQSSLFQAARKNTVTNTRSCDSNTKTEKLQNCTNYRKNYT